MANSPYQRKRKRLKFGRYPYTVTRIKVMKSLLLTKDDYRRMMQMGLHEMIRSLEEGTYKQEIDLFAQDYAGTELLELALHANLARTVNKIFRISLNKKEVVTFLSLYANKWVFQNIKAVFRAKLHRIEEGDLKYALVPIAPTTYEFCATLVREPDGRLFAFLATALDSEAVNAMKAYYGSGDLAGIENTLDITYYTTLATLLGRLKLRENDPLKMFIKHTLDLINIRTILKFKRAGSTPEVIEKFLISSPLSTKKDPSTELLQTLMAAEDLDAMLAALKASLYKELVTPEVESNVMLLEDQLETFLFHHAFRMLHRMPLSISPIFGFLLLKESEVRNLKLLLHAKALSLPSDFVDRHLIVPRK